MKRNALNPGFEIIFCTGIIMMMLLPPLLKAQEPKELKVTIVNSDTTINGKNIKQLSATEHLKAIQDY